MARPDFRTPRLYVGEPLAAGAEIVLNRSQANYLRNVLRLLSGAEVLAFNGRDGEWRARLGGTRRHAVLAVDEFVRAQPSPGSLALAFAPLKHVRLDYMVQKAVEMGTAVLAPVLTQHTQVARVNVDRMRANAVGAAEQCGILALPRIEEPQPLDRWLSRLEPERIVIFCDEGSEERDPLAALAAAPAGPIAVLIGPEGGFSDDERRALLARAVRLSLGPRILRADTAAVAALALVQAARGDWR